MNPIKLSVFTEPISSSGFLPGVKFLFRSLKFLLTGKKTPPRKKYGGHYAVTRSLVEGLQKIGADYNYNPGDKKHIFENVIVLASVERLKEVIEIKKNGRIKILIAGPNVVDDVLSENELVADPAIDYYVVPSEWVKRLAINDCDQLKDRVLCWPAGVDGEYWTPTVKRDQRDEVLIYWKTETEDFCRLVIEIVTEQGMQPAVIKSGTYTLDEYKKQLDRSQFAIFISRSESQGIALAEAWSMDVPTFVFDPGELFFYGRLLNDVSSCPYLTPMTGLTWKNPEELKNLISNKDSFTGFSPREYVLNQLTDQHCAKRLVESIGSLKVSPAG